MTAFAAPGAMLSAVHWVDVFGAEPDQVMKQPGMPSVEGGVKNGKRWLIAQQPSRVDIIVAPENPSHPPSDLLSVGDFQAVIDPLLDASKRAFGHSTSVQRLAVGATLFDPVETIRDGFRIFQSIVPQMQRLPDGVTDLLVQMNVPITIDDVVPGMILNRLLKWQIAAMQLFGIAPGLNMPFQVAVTGTRIVVKLDLDINTSPDRAVPIPNDKLGLLVSRLGSAAKELAKVGGFPS